IVGSAGSGKTALTLEKMKHAEGDVLYVTHSAYLAQSARDLYYANGFERDGQDAVFLAYREFVETLRVCGTSSAPPLFRRSSLRLIWPGIPRTKATGQPPTAASTTQWEWMAPFLVDALTDYSLTTRSRAARKQTAKRSAPRPGRPIRSTCEAVSKSAA